MFLVLVAFLKPYHSHKLATSAEVSTSHHETTESTHQHQATHEHSKDCGSDCDKGSDCACPLHRVNGCSPLTALAKTERVDLLDLSSMTGPESLFLAKTSPVLDGPFRPPLV